MFDAHTILLIRSIGVAVFILISLASTVGYLYLHENGVTSSLMACTLAAAILAGFILYTSLALIALVDTLPPATINLNYWNWVREAIGWWGSCIVNVWLWIILVRHQKGKNERPI